MKKKFNFYCVVMLVALLASLLVPMANSFVRGIQSGIHDAETERLNKENKKAGEDKQVYDAKGTMAYVEMIPKSMLNTADSLYNEKTQQNEAVQVFAAMVKSKANTRDEHKLFNYGMPVIGIIGTIVILTFLVFFVKIILAVNKDRIFDQKMESRLAKCGWLLIAYYALKWVTEIASYLHNLELYDFSNYYVSIVNYPSAAFLMAGIGMLLIGQIFRIARTMKEEQELTI